MTTIAIAGAGFVADYYVATLANHPGLRPGGVWDHMMPSAAQASSADFHGLSCLSLA
jgi:hypothetical protein